MGALTVMVCSLALLASVCSSASGDHSTGAQAQRVGGWLHTRNGVIVDGHNHPVRFTGILYTRLSPGRGQPSSQTGSECTGWTAPTTAVYDNIQSWGFNIVRLGITWANMEPNRPIKVGPLVFQDWNEAYLNAVDKAVDEFTSRGVAVMLELSQNKWSPAYHRQNGCPGRGMPAWLYEGTTMNTIQKAKQAFFRDDRDGVQEGYIAAYKLLAKRYASNPLVVAADMFNEPYASRSAMSPREMNLGGFYEKVGTGIRQVNTHLLLLFQDNQTLKDYESALKHPPPFPNVVYQFHLYTRSWEPDGMENIQRVQQRAENWGLPLFMGEFNAFGYAEENRSHSGRWLRDLKALMAYTKSAAVSWTFAAYSGGNSLVEPGTDQPKPQLLPTLQNGY
jgi:hypothetical protein